MKINPLARLAASAAVAAITLSTALAAPQFAAAQAYPDDGRYSNDQPYYDPCARDKADRSVAGGLLGGVAGAVIGSNLAHGGGRTGGAVIGGVAGAALGAGVGNSTAACQDAPPPPPPPPPPVRRYRDDYYQDAPPPPPPPICGSAVVRTYFPDGTQERRVVRACEDNYGRYHLAP